MKTRFKIIIAVLLVSMIGILAFIVLVYLTFSEDIIKHPTTKYSAESITATVVDFETDKPIEGVIVVAYWMLEGGLEGGNNLGEVMVMESVTGKDGVFRLPAWGPKVIPANLPSNARLKEKDPGLLFYKYDYSYLGLQNSKSMDEYASELPEIRKSDWNGKVIKLYKFNGTLEEYARHLRSFNSDLHSIAASSGAKCEWKNLPKTLLALEQLKQHYLEANINTATFYDNLKENEQYFSAAGCGSFKEFIRGYKNEQ